MAFVYLLGDSGQDNTYKIGVTRENINKRIKQLQTGNGEEIYLVDYYETEHPFFIERFLHMKFAPKQKLNEWFMMDIKDVDNFKNYCSTFDKSAKSLKNNNFVKTIK